MAGTNDSAFASEFANAGFVVLGGYNLDEETNEAARKELERGIIKIYGDISTMPKISIWQYTVVY